MKQLTALQKAQAEARKWHDLAKSGSSPYITEKWLAACGKIRQIKSDAIGSQKKLFI